MYHSLSTKMILANPPPMLECDRASYKKSCGSFAGIEALSPRTHHRSYIFILLVLHVIRLKGRAPLGVLLIVVDCLLSCSDVSIPTETFRFVNLLKERIQLLKEKIVRRAKIVYTTWTKK